jgi:hypothetical protein
MNNQPIIFDLKYTPYSPQRDATPEQIEEYKRQRAFYNMAGNGDYYDYMTRDGKCATKFTMFEYLQKSTGVFNQNGMIPEEELKAMKQRARENKGNLWHGFISFNETDSPKIDTPEKCINLIKRTFPSFFSEAGFNPKNMDLMCALHLDKPHHLHIHFEFWEKEPKIQDKKTKEMTYRRKGRIGDKAIDNMFVRLAIFADNDKDGIHEARDKAVKLLRDMTNVKRAMYAGDSVRKEIIALAKALPKTGRLSYGSSDMEPYKGRVDKIVQMLLDYDGTARKADYKFYEELEERKRVIANACGKEYSLAGDDENGGNVKRELPKYHHKIDMNNIKIIEKIEADYKRRQGNLVLNLCKFINVEFYERKQWKKYKTCDNDLRRKMAISKRKIGKQLDRFFLTFGKDSQLLERDFSQRLQEIEREIEKKQKDEQEQNIKEAENYKE